MPTDWASCFLEDAEIAPLFSTKAFASHFLALENALLRAQIAERVVDGEQGRMALNQMADFTVNLAGLHAGLSRDGVWVPAFVSQLKDHCDDHAAEAVHVGTTSHDLVDTAFSLAFAQCITLFQSRLSELATLLQALIERHGETKMMGRTRMQAALAIPVSHRIHGWSDPLNKHMAELDRLRQSVCRLQLSGPVGTGVHNDLKVHKRLHEAVAQELKLHIATGSWQTDRSTFIAFGSSLAALTGSLGKMGADVALMAQQGVDDIALSKGGSSSAMAHKNNPILAEKLVAIARYCAGLVGMLHSCQIHEQERSGVAWTMEWLLLPQLCQLTGRALLDAKEIVGQIERIGPPG